MSLLVLKAVDRCIALGVYGLVRERLLDDFDCAG
jgi:hypothetical protein